MQQAGLGLSAITTLAHWSPLEVYFLINFPKSILVTFIWEFPSPGANQPVRKFRSRTQLLTTPFPKFQNVWGYFAENVTLQIRYLNAVFVALLAASCPSGWFKERSSCYKLSKNVLNWQAAKKACEDLNSTLAIISSLAEHQALKRHISGTRKNTWIGLHRDRSDQNGWLWVDGSRLNDSHWGKNEPNNIAEKCVEMRFSKTLNGRWNDQTCSDRINYICEKGKEDKA